MRVADAAEMIGVSPRTFLRRLRNVERSRGLTVLLRFGTSRNSPYFVTITGLRAVLPHVFGEREPDAIDIEELHDAVALVRQRQDLIAERFRKLERDVKRGLQNQSGSK